MKILSCGPITAQIVREAPIQKQELLVGDSTGSMKLTVWDSLVSKFEKDKSYVIKNLTTRFFQNAKALTTTKNTLYEPAEDIINCVEPSEQTDVIEKEGKITQVCLLMNFTCETCKGKVPLSEDDSKFIRCPSCKMKMAKESLQKNIHGTLCFSFNQEKVRLSIFSSTLYTLAIANQLNTNDTEGMEDFLLSHSFKIAFSTEAKIIQNIVHVTNVAGLI